MGTIVIRTPLADDEWRAVRALALELDRPAGELVVDAMRESETLAPAFAKVEKDRRRAKRQGRA